MATLHELDPDQPVTSLFEASKVTPAEAARARGITWEAADKAMRTGDRVQLSTLRAWARALGGEIVLSLKKDS
jgi:hypothetical protein